MCTPTRRMICNLFNTQSWMTASLVECVSLTMVRVRNLVWSDGCETSCVFVWVWVCSFRLATITLGSTLTLHPNSNYCSIHAAVETATPRCCRRVFVPRLSNFVLRLTNLLGKILHVLYFVTTVSRNPVHEHKHTLIVKRMLYYHIHMWGYKRSLYYVIALGELPYFIIYIRWRHTPVYIMY